MEIIEGSATRLSEEQALTTRSEWNGDSPFFLIFEYETKPETGNIGIDIDTPGWITEHAETFRTAGTWWLIHKDSQQPVLALVVHAGEQAYFTRHHVGNVINGNEITTYGLGKKVPARYTMSKGSRPKRLLASPERYERLWLLPNGVVCSGDDVDILGSRMVG